MNGKPQPVDRSPDAQAGFRGETRPGQPVEQMSLFGCATRAVPGSGTVDARSPGRVMTNPHLLAARKLARRMRRLPDRSPEEIQAGLDICRQLKAYLESESSRPH